MSVLAVCLRYICLLLSSSIRPCLYMSPLLCWSRVSLPQLHGALQPRERHLESTVRMSMRMSILSLSLICYVLTFFLSVYLGVATVYVIPCLCISELTVLCRTLSVYVSRLVSIYVISCLCVVRNFNFCLASLAFV